MRKQLLPSKSSGSDKEIRDLRIFVPILGLGKISPGQRLEEIQELTQYGLEKIEDTSYKRITFATIGNQLGDLLHIISDIFFTQNKVCIKANFELPAITDPGIFRSHQHLSSLGLGLITKLFYDYRKYQKQKPKFDILCITGVLNKNPTREQKKKGDFLSRNTGKVEEKLIAFLNYINTREDLKNKRCAFIYCGSVNVGTLKILLNNYNLPHVVIKRFVNFNTLMSFIGSFSYDKKPPVKKWLWLLIPFTLLFIILCFIIVGIAVNPKKDNLYLLQKLKREGMYEAGKKVLPKAFEGSDTPLPPLVSEWAQKAILKECLYIVDCSFTEYTTHNTGSTPNKDAYGCLNNVRIYQKGPDWVKPRESAMGAIGLMRGVIELKAMGYNCAPFDQVLRKFFWDWAGKRAWGKAQYNNVTDTDDGAWTEEVRYSTTGDYQGRTGWSAGSTAAVLIALWKYYEYNLDTGQTVTADDWLHHAWPQASRGANFLCRMYNAKYRLVQSHTTYADMWIADSSLACTALQCIDRWIDIANKKENYDYKTYANNIVEGLHDMGDNGTWKNFFRVRRSDGTREYAECIDQLCFIPFEVDALPAGDLDHFARHISDWWTDPGANSNFKMTAQTTDPADWRYWGTHWKHHFMDNIENTRLYPGPGFQLAKVEWKYGRLTGNPEYTQRALKRFRWGCESDYSDLWFGVKGLSEAGVSNDFVDWRDQYEYDKTDSSWARFIDTSSYFIQVCAMICYNVDTKLTPVK